jgi:hypothetical protein
LLQQLEQHRFPGFEVAQHVRLGQADAAAQLGEAHVGHRHLAEHRQRGVEDLAAPLLPLLGAARSLERHASSVTPGSLDYRLAVS